MMAKVRSQSQEQPLRETLDLEQYLPFLLTSLSNRLSSSASRRYVQKFGVGVLEWRVLAGAAAVPGARPNDICQLVGIDKGGVARSIRTLVEKGIISTADGEKDGRSKHIHITDAGWVLHEAIRKEALARERKLLEPLTDNDRQRLITLLRILLDQLPMLRD
jgi:DNA-binding MarR family transcriptional regulator